MVRIAQDGLGAERASLRALFNGFLKVALCNVGGSGGIVFAPSSPIRRVVSHRLQKCRFRIRSLSRRTVDTFHDSGP